MSVTINEIRQARNEAEQQILIILKAFKERTGLTIVGCDVETYAVRNIDLSRTEISPAIAVRLKVEQI